MKGKQRTYLKKISHGMKPIIQMGKEGVSPAFIAQVNETIEKRELIKISILDNCSEDIKDAAEKVVSRTNSEFVQLIGRKLTIYRKNKLKPVIVLPK